MEQNDKIKELFSEKLGNFESSVRPELWSNIASQIGTTTTITSVASSFSLVTKTIIGMSVAAAVGGFAYFTLINPSQNTTKQDIELTTDKTKEKEKSTFKTANIPTIKTNVNVIDNADLDNQSVESLDVDTRISPTKDLLGFVSKTEVLPIADVQPTDLKLSETRQEQNQAQEHPVISEDPSTENIDSQSNSSAVLEIENVTFELPNVFSPNNDGVNDYLEIKSAGLSDFSLVVLDINGKPVFQTADINFKWDGMNISNEKVKDGNYLYYITARGADGKLISKSQTLRITTQH